MGLPDWDDVRIDPYVHTAQQMVATNVHATTRGQLHFGPLPRPVRVHPPGVMVTTDQIVMDDFR